LFFNVFFFLAKILFKFLEKKPKDISNAQFCANNFDTIHQGYKVGQLYNFVFSIGLTYFNLHKSIKTLNFDLYVISCKAFLKWALSTGENVKKKKIVDLTTGEEKIKTKIDNTGSTNYFRIVTLHLFDLYFVYNDLVLDIIKKNFAFNYNGNPIPFDELTEMKQREMKKGVKSVELLKQRSVNFQVSQYSKELMKNNVTNYTKDIKIPNIHSKTDHPLSEFEGTTIESNVDFSKYKTSFVRQEVLKIISNPKNKAYYV